MPVPPADLTVLSLTHATAKQLRFWIDGANREAGSGKRVMTKQGRVQALREKLAEYYRIDLSKLPPKPMPPGPSPIDAGIQQRQWDGLIQLGEEWAEAGESFRLCEPQGEPAFQLSIIY